jgi:hypothetical protein
VKFAVILHDAGSAEVILSYIREIDGDIFLVANGPALKVLPRYGNNYQLIDLETVINHDFDVVFLGLSFPSNIDLLVIKSFKTKRALLVSFLDHWSFSERDFMLDGLLVLPDVFVVTDSEAFQLAKRIFLESEIIQIGNPYLQDCVTRFQKLGQPSQKFRQILFVSEPLDIQKNLEFLAVSELGHETKIEDEVFSYFVSCLETLDWQRHRIKIRPHPRQKISDFGKNYFDMLPDLVFSTNPDLLLDLHESDIVVGIHSMALYISANLGIPTYSSLPPGAGDCAIRGVQIDYLRDLVR